MNPLIHVKAKYYWKVYYDCIKWCKISKNIFIAIKEGEDNLYFCQLMEIEKTKKYFEIIEKCKNNPSIMQVYDSVTIDNLTYIFYEHAQPVENINEKKLLKMFIELNDINTSNFDFIINYCIIKIVNNENYKIYLMPSIEENTNELNDIYLINSIINFFKKNNLKYLNYLKKIYYCLLGMDKADEKEMRKGFLKRKLMHLMENLP